MALYLIHAYEDMYGGLHGMEDVLILEEDNEEEVRLTAKEMSMDVIDSYSSIRDALEEEAAEYHEIDSDEYWNTVDELIEEDIAYDYWKLSDEYSEQEYNIMLTSEGWEEVQKYAV